MSKSLFGDSQVCLSLTVCGNLLVLSVLLPGGFTWNCTNHTWYWLHKHKLPLFSNASALYREVLPPVFTTHVKIGITGIIDFYWHESPSWNNVHNVCKPYNSVLWFKPAAIPWCLPMNGTMRRMLGASQMSPYSLYSALPLNRAQWELVRSRALYRE